MTRLFRLEGRIWISTQLAACGILLASPCWAVSGTQFDNFSGGELHGWGYSSTPTPVGNVAENGPSANDAGVGALHMDTSLYGNGKLLVTNASGWTGDWSGAAISQIAMDVRNPNAFALSMHIGIAGAGGATATGDVHVTPGVAVPADNQWHVIVFDVLAANFTSVSGASTVAALVGVTQLRILHNPSNGVFTGAFGGEFYLDNIRVVAPFCSGRLQPKRNRRRRRLRALARQSRHINHTTERLNARHRYRRRLRCVEVPLRPKRQQRLRCQCECRCARTDNDDAANPRGGWHMPPARSGRIESAGKSLTRDTGNKPPYVEINRSVDLQPRRTPATRSTIRAFAAV